MLEGTVFGEDPVAGLDPAAARELTRQIRVGLEHSYTLIIAAWRGRAWAAMGYSSWDAYCQGEFGNLALQPPREERQAVVLSLREAGMSIRAIVSATGLGQGTVVREIHTGSEASDPEDSAISTVPNGTVEIAGSPSITGVNGKTYKASVPAAQTERVSSGLLFEDVPLSDELLAMSPDEVGIGLLTPAPARSGRDRKAATRRMTGSADAPLPMVIRLAGEIALDPGALVVEEDTDAEELAELVTDASRGVLALSHVLSSIDATVFSADAAQLAAVSAAVTDAVSELGRFLDDVHAGGRDV